MADEIKTVELPDVPPSITQLKSEQESKMFGVTIRGWIAIEVVTVVCVMSLLKIKVEEPVYTLVISVCSFYMGSKMSTMVKQGEKQ